MTHYTIRLPKPEDLPELVQLCALHAAYERGPYDASGKVEALHRGLFSTEPQLHAWVVEQEGSLIGYATYLRQYATWEAAEYVYLDCLFLTEACRGHGIGEQLVRRIQQRAAAWGCREMQWQTPEFNTRAMKFYDRLGATHKRKARYFLSVESTQE